MQANEQLDRLIHSKVMGQPLDVPCTQEHNLIDGEYWRCACGWISTDLDHTEHAQQIPAYSTSLDATWLIMDKLKPGRSNDANGFWERVHVCHKCSEEMEGWWSWEKERLARAICLAAFEAYGVEIESDHAS